MTTSDQDKGGGKHAFPADAEEARTDIELTRKELGDTVEALAHKLDVRERAKEQWHHKTEQVQQQAHHAAGRAREATPDRVLHSAENLTGYARSNPAPVLIGAGVAIIIGWLIAYSRNR